MATTSEVTAADIARIAGVGRAAVSNWRRRHPDFPAPTGGPANSPTFALADVEAWLDANGRAAGTEAARRSPGRDAEPANARLFEPIAALLPSLTHGTVVDPACGDGSLLAATAQRLGPHLRYIGYVGQIGHIDRGTDQERANQQFEIRPGSPNDDQLAELRRVTDAVISVAPVTDHPIDGLAWEFGQPSRSDYPLAWVQFCLSYVKPGGTVVVAVPFATAVRASGRRIRAELLRAGVLTGVIGLPEKIVGATSPWQIWNMTRPIDRPDYVLRMVDLTDGNPDDLPRDDKAWAKIFADTARTRVVPSIELLDEDVLLVPAAHITHDARDVAPDYTKLRRRYAETAARLATEAPTFTAGGTKSSAGTKPSGALVTIADLARSAAVTFIDRDAARPGDVLVPSGTGGFEAIVIEDGYDGENKALSVVRCNPETLDPYFLACFLRSETNRRQAAGTMGGTFRLDVRRARVPRMPLSEQRRYGEAFRRLMAFSVSATDVAAAATDATRTAIYGLTGGAFAPPAKRK